MTINFEFARSSRIASDELVGGEQIRGIRRIWAGGNGDEMGSRDAERTPNQAGTPAR